MVSTNRREGGFPGYPLASKQPKGTSVLIQPAAGEMIGEVTRSSSEGTRMQVEAATDWVRAANGDPFARVGKFIIYCFIF